MITYPPYSDELYKSILLVVDLPDWDNWKTDCWLWKGSTNEKGYPKKTINSKQYRVHRLIAVWNEHLTETDLDASHLCDIRNCINPNHLVLETHSDNLKRRIWIPRPPKLICECGITIKHKHSIPRHLNSQRHSMKTQQSHYIDNKSDIG